MWPQRYEQHRHTYFLIMRGLLCDTTSGVVHQGDRENLGTQKGQQPVIQSV